MNDNNLSIKTQFGIIRTELETGLRRLEAEGGRVEDAAAHLTKLGIVLAMSTLGATETIRGLLAQVQQLRENFPAEAIAADELNKLAIAPVEGSA